MGVFTSVDVLHLTQKKGVAEKNVLLDWKRRRKYIKDNEKNTPFGYGIFFLIFFKSKFCRGNILKGGKITKMKKALLLFLVLTLVFSFSCKKAQKEEVSQAGKTDLKSEEKVSEKAAEAAAESKKATEPKKVVEAVDFNALKELLPEVAGWIKENPRGFQSSYGNFSVSIAEASYLKGEAKIETVLMDSTGRMEAMGSFKMMSEMKFSVQDDNHYVKTYNLDGYPAVEEYNFKQKNGTLQVLVVDRFLVTLRGRNIENTEVLKSFFKNFDLKKMASI